MLSQFTNHRFNESAHTFKEFHPLHYFIGNGKKGYEFRMNAVLESYVKAQPNQIGDR